MVQEQLVDYISSQMKLGISRDAIKAALTGAGWQPADVEDTLKKVESGKGTVQPVTSTFSSSKPAVTTTTVSTTTTKTVEPQSIKVSDLVSAPDSSAAFFSAVSGKNSSSKSSPMSTTATEYPPKKHSGSTIMMIVGVIIILALAGAAAYLYSQNSSLTSKVTSLSNTSSDITANITTLNSQVQALNASNTAITAELASETAVNQDLQTNLSFVVVPPGTTSSTPSSTITLTGTLSGGGKVSYLLTTQYGVKAFVANSKDPKVIAALNPIVTSTSTPAASTQLTGSHVPGSQSFTVTAVNGATF